ncbi:hypothetical protein MKLM6_0073 [Methylomonas koyamae]|nr:hypothetical protein MKLM6_0073 [Methylomonas koyamae]
MAKVAPIALETSKVACLKAILKKGSDWRERNRAETILLLSAGHSIQVV